MPRLPARRGSRAASRTPHRSREEAARTGIPLYLIGWCEEAHDKRLAGAHARSRQVCRPQTHPRDPFPFRSPKWRPVAYPNDAKAATLEKAHSQSRTGLSAANGGQDSGRHAQGEHLRRREANVPAPRLVSARTSQACRSPACRASPRTVRGEVSSVSESPTR